MTFPVASKLLDACVLGIISIEATYGYDLTQKISSHIDVSESALYPVLKRLLKESALTTYDTQIDGRNRKYYKITPEGVEKLKIYRADWEDHKTTIEKMILGGEINE